MNILKKSLKKAAIEIRPSNIHRYGVFATRPIAANEIIEECPVLLISKDDVDLVNYWFRWDENNPEKNALALGYGTLYNHSQNANASFKPDLDRQIIVITAKQNIATDEEILVYYSDVWFKEHGVKEIKPRTEKQDTLFLAIKVLIIVAIIIAVHQLFK